MCIRPATPEVSSAEPKGSVARGTISMVPPDVCEYYYTKSSPK